jgi:light-regulated signal transduction histidine kinase (bacteriophytochrome)
MAKKINDHRTCTPTYEELEQRVKELEEQALEHKEGEKKLRCHVAGLEGSKEELKRFVYLASHDLQESLDVVSTYLRFVEARYKGRLDSDANEFIASAVDGADRLQSLINDLKAYLRREARAGYVGANGANH